MMIKKKSNPWARLKYLYVLPLATIAVAAFARPEISSELDEISNAKVSDLSAIVKAESPKNVVEDQKTTVPQDQVVNQDEVFMVVENPPEYPGGIQELMKFLGKNIRYPVEALKANIQGRVIVEFVVLKDGSVANLEVKRSVHPLLDEEALRVLATMPKWKPGTQKGKAVNVKFTIPVAFSLMSTEKKTQDENKLSLQILSNEKNDALDRAQQSVKTPGTATNTLKSPIIVVDKKVMGAGFKASKDINPNDIESIVVLKGHEKITKFISQGIPLQLSETEIQKFNKLYDKEKNNGVLFIVMKKK